MYLKIINKTLTQLLHSLHCHALCQVPRHIRILAALHRKEIRQHLHGNDIHDGLRRVDIGHLDPLVEDLVTLGRDANDETAARLQLDGI